MKKVISILLLCSFILLLFASCMSKKEKEQARKNEETAKPIIEEYINEKFKGALIKDLECMTNTVADLFVSTYATDYVKAEISYDKKTFNVVVNLETGEFYSDYYKQKIADDIESLIFDEIWLKKPRDIEVKFMLNDFEESVDDGWNYLEEDIDGADELLKTGRYQMFVLCKYANSQANFKSIPIKSLFKSEYTGDLHIAFVNYKDESSCDDGEVLDSGRIDSLSSLFDSAYNVYNISDIRSASQVNKKSWYSGGESTKEELVYCEYKEDYKHYKSQTVNNVEFIWNDECYDIDFTKVTAEPVVTVDKYSNSSFYAVSESAIKLNCTVVNYLAMNGDNSVYMYFPKDLNGAYAIIEDDGRFDAERLSSYRDKYTCYSKELNCLDCEFTVGFYKIVDNKQKQ